MNHTKMSDDRKRKLLALAASTRKSGQEKVSRRGPVPTEELPPRNSSSSSKTSSRGSKGMFFRATATLSHRCIQGFTAHIHRVLEIFYRHNDADDECFIR